MGVENLRKNYSEEPEKEKVFGEDQFFSLLRTIPNELAQVWEDEYYSLDDSDYSDFFEKFQRFINDRKLALMNNVEVVLGTDKKIVDEIISIYTEIQNTYYDEGSRLGIGRLAKVNVHPSAPNICVKYIKDVALYGTDISLNLECDRLDQIRSFEVNGVRTPAPYFIDMNTNMRHILGMERIFGKDLSQLLMEHPEENEKLIKLVKSLDRNEVEERLVTYIRGLHEKFKMTHNDLYMRNIMIDFEGNFYIIDLGKSKLEEFNEDHQMYRDYDIKLLRTEIKDFFTKLDSL